MSYSAVFKSVRELGSALRRREGGPVELAETFLERLERLGPRYNAVVTVTRERALEQARHAEAELRAGIYRGPLHGIPYGAKDLLATSGGIPTTWGAAPLSDQTFDYDATVVRKLEDAGAVLVAKLSMVEFAGGLGRYDTADAAFNGPGLNPWDPDRWSGGSSSGSGSAVSAGLVPFALGTETWGSIVIPATNCGVAGLRPTYGRVSRHGAMVLSWTLDKIGPLALTADDCGLVLDAIAGPDANDTAASDRAFEYDSLSKPGRKFRLAVLENATEGVDDDVRGAFQHALDALADVATVETVALPDLPYIPVPITILFAESASAQEDFIESGRASELTSPEDRYPYARSAVLAKDYLKAMGIRGVIAKAIDGVLGGFDALVAPSSPAVAPRVDRPLREWMELTDDVVGALGNAAGLPAVAVPNGFSSSGLPTGIQFVGRAYDENAVLAVARTFQSLTDWHRRHPPGLA